MSDSAEDHIPIEPAHGVIRTFRINEDDLQELERVLPQIECDMAIHLRPKHRVMMNSIKKIMSDVRWNYGPAQSAEIYKDTNHD